MFDPGTKVIVLASTQKSGAGPRKGSVGHIVESGNGTLVEHNTLATLNKVCFHKFGFEQKTRFESRTVTNLLRLLNNSTEDSITKQVLSFFNFFNLPEIDDIVQKINNNLQLPLGTPVVVIVPYSEIDDDLLTCKGSEFETWVKAMSIVIARTSYAIHLDTPMYTNNSQLSKKKLQSLNSMVNDRGLRDEHIKFMMNDPTARKDFVQTVGYLLTMQNNNTHALRRNSFSDFVSHGIYNTYSNNKFTPETIKVVYKLLYDNMYNLSFDSLVRRLTELKPGRECVKNVALMKKEFKSMSERLLSENTSN